MAPTIPRPVSVTRDGKSYRGTYSLDGETVTVSYAAPDGTIRQMSRPIDGLKAVAVARAILLELA